MQVVIYDEDMARPLRSEFRDSDYRRSAPAPGCNENEHLATGKIEVVAESIEVLAKSDALPFQVSTALENESENKLPGRGRAFEVPVTSTCVVRPCSAI